MSIEAGDRAALDEATGVPELSELGKRIEMLRIERGLSKQLLARFARTSRQQLWRVLTGKSELTTSLRERLAQALEVDPSILSSTAPTPRFASSWSSGQSLAESRSAMLLGTFATAESSPAETLTLERFLAGSASIERVLRQLPSGEPGRRLKRALLDAVEDLAVEHGIPLRRPFFDLRRRVLAGDL